MDPKTRARDRSKSRCAPGLFATVASAGLLLTIFASCGGNPSSSGTSSAFSPANSSTGLGAGIPQLQHLVIVVLENADYTDVVGSPSAPYINRLIAKGGLASNYFAVVHPSIGNYFAMTTGAVPTTDDSFTGIVSIDNVVRELTSSSKTWKVYAQSLPSPGYLGSDVYPYLRRHNPFSYLSDVQGSTARAANIVDFDQFSADISAGQLPAYSFVVPDAQHDAHDCPGIATNLICDISVRIAQADNWLSGAMPQLLSSAQFQQDGLLVIVFDESRDDGTNGGGRVMALLVGTGVKAGYVGGGQYNHYSLLNLGMTALGIRTIPGDGARAAPMTEFFQ